MAKKKIIKKKSRFIEAVKECYFCKEKKNPDFMEYDVLRRYTSERGKILSRPRTGNCAKHQRKLTLAIKRARFLALLPFIARLE